MTDQPQKLDLNSPDLSEEKKQALFSLFPEIRTEGGKIDFERLRLVLGETVDVGKERYGMNWPGKAACFQAIRTPSSGTLLPCQEESINFDSSENLIIEGDNLEVLKLMQKAYLGKVKMIYIDPPYNTGNDFIYPDDYTEGVKAYLELTGQTDSEGRKFSTNSETDGRFHSRWMNMLYPRLFLARNLLRDDGVILISIDDSELVNLKTICNDVFGEENFVATVIWQKVFSPKNTAQYFSDDHEYILIYAKLKDIWRPELIDRSEESLARYGNPDNDPRGKWMSGALQARNFYSKGQYDVISPTGKVYKNPKGTYWRFSKERFLELDKDNRIWWGESGDNVPRLKRFLSEVKSGVVPQTLWLHTDVGHTQEAKAELLGFVDFENTENVLNSVKPTRLIQKMIHICTQNDTNDLVLDFFSGSAPTAHAILDQNNDDNGNRKFILVQLPEPLKIPEQNVKTIADLGKSRINNVINKLNKANEGQLPLGNPQDRGFRVFKLAQSNFHAWDAQAPKDAESLTRQLELHINHIREGRTTQDLLFEIILKSGFALTTPVERLSLAGKEIFHLENGALMVCLESEITLEVIRAMAALQPQRVVCLDAGFKGDDSLKVNAAEIFRTAGVPSFKTV